MKLDHIHIENFLTFEKLEINTLKQVNLIAGKNNAGKTSLLQAIQIKLSLYTESKIKDIIRERGFATRNHNNSYRYIDICNRELLNREITKTKINGLSISYDETGRINVEKNNQIPIKSINREDDYVFVPFSSNFENLNTFWLNIRLTDKEDGVLRILRESIDSSIVSFLVDSSTVIVRLENAKKPVNIKTLGDGVQRILMVALSLANAQGKVLLIDEIEMGLHWSVMKKLWEMIFKYAKEWDIQVFATTHSMDAIRTFYYVASQEENKNEGQFMRLQKSRKGMDEAIIYDMERMDTSMEMDLEIR